MSLNVESTAPSSSPERHVHRARWALNGDSDKVILETSSGIVEPEALAIWEAEFEERAEIQGLAISRPSDDIPKIEFSRTVMELSLVARGSVTEGLHIVVMGTVRGRNADLPVPVPPQIVIDDCWCLVDRDTVAETEALLQTKGILASRPINVGQLVWLRARNRLPIPFSDLTTDTDAPAANRQVSDDELGLSLGTKLYPYQRTGVSFLASVARESLGCVLGDEMGLGKTLQVIALLSLEIAAGRGHNLIVCPATLLENHYCPN